jgi:hypothetical protein
LILTKIPKINVETKTKYCINKQCLSYAENAYKEDIFCKKCGTKIEEITKTELQNISFDDTTEEFGNIDIFYKKYGENIAIPITVPNKLKPHLLRFSDGDEDAEKSKEYDIPNKELSLQIFKEVYADFLNFLLQKEYEYEIKFGVLQY